MRRRGPTGKTRNCKIGRAPEKMDGTAFAAKTGTKILEDAVALQEDPPKPVPVFGIVGPVFVILVGTILIDSIRIWIGILGGTRSADVAEAPFVVSQLNPEEV